MFEISYIGQIFTWKFIQTERLIYWVDNKSHLDIYINFKIMLNKYKQNSNHNFPQSTQINK